MEGDSNSESDNSKSSNKSTKKSTSRLSSSSSSSGSRDDSGSSSDSYSGDVSRSRKADVSRKARLADIKHAYEENPDVYGIRRSGRERKEPERLSVKERALPSRAANRTSAVWGSSDSGSESDRSRQPRPSRRPGCATRRQPAPARRRRQLSDSSESDSDSDAVSRGTSRRAGSRINYREQQDEATDEDDIMEVDDATAAAAAEAENAETVEKVLTDRIGKVGATGAATTVYTVKENCDPNADFDAADPEQSHEVQYLLKWKGWSNLHNTWESEATLKAQGVKGLKKIDNYRKKQDEVKAYLASCGPEDAEYFVCQNQLQEDLISSYLEVDRIIGEWPKPGHEYPDYLVKWCNLPYSECTWEDGTLVASKFSHRIDEFVAREQSRKTPTKLNHVLRRRPKFVSFSRQPDFFGGLAGDLVLRDYQLDGVNWMVHSWCRGNSVILADEMGLGKTIQTTCFMYYLFQQHSLFGPYLVVVPLSTLPAWQREMAKWAPQMNVVTYLGDVTSREKIRQYEWCFPGNKRLKFNVLLTSYEIMLKDKSFLGAISWAALLVDEAHRLKNEESLLYKMLIEFNTNFRLLITGTPLQNSLKELWSLLHFIMPVRFDRWDNFEGDMDQGSKAYTRLHKLLEPFLLRRVKKDVEKSLPAKVEQILRVGMTSVQRQFYKWILTRNYTMLKRGVKAAAPSLINVIMELKKCCNHAQLTKPHDHDPSASNAGILQSLLRGSGKLMLLDKLLVRLRERGHRVLIFSQMVRMLDLLADYMHLRHFPFQRLDGGMRGELRRQALDHFNADGSQDFCFLLSTRAGGLGINLATADTVVIYDSDWNPQNDLQAQSRAHRIGQKNQVNIYRLVTMQSIEEDIIERAKQKMVLDHLVIQSMDSTGRTVLKKGGATTPFNKDELNAILKFGAGELFNRDEDEDDDEHATCDIDLILQRAETREDDPVNAPANDLLSAFKVASFQVDEDEVASVPTPPTAADETTKDWDDIIPSDMRTKLEEEERQREMEDLYLPPRSRKTVQAAAAEEDEREERRKRRHDNSDGAESDSEQTKKRARLSQSHRVKGFTDSEVRRFFKAFRRFGCPLERLEAISTEAELQEKSAADLRRLGDTIISSCKDALQQQQLAKDSGAADPENGEPAKAGGRKKRECGPSFRLSGVAINAKTTLQTLEDLEPLHRIMPADVKQRRAWLLQPTNGRVKDVHWDVEWGIEEDSRLLQGVYEYGTGAWESIKIDPSLRLENKILLERAEGKPQAKQLQTRTDYLLKVVRKSQQQQTEATPKAAGAAGTTATTKKTKKPSTGRNKKAVSKEIIEGDDISSDDNTQAPLPAAKENKDTKAAKPAKKEERKPRKKKQPTGPMHFTANHEPVQVSSTEELPEAVFLECKEKMRPVKRALKALDSPDPSLSDSEQVNHTRQCLIQIGSHIDRCLLDFQQADKIKEWRSNLWYFVSKFTEFDPRKLYKLYKHAVKKQAADSAPPAEDVHRAASKDKEKVSRREKKRRDSSEQRPAVDRPDKRREQPEPAGRTSPERRHPPAPHLAQPQQPHQPQQQQHHQQQQQQQQQSQPAQRHGDHHRYNTGGGRRDGRHERPSDERSRHCADWRRDWPRPGHTSQSAGAGYPADGDYPHCRDRSRDREYRVDRHHPAGGYRSTPWHQHQHGRPPPGYDRYTPSGYGGSGYGGGGYGRHHGRDDPWKERRDDYRRESDRRPPSAAPPPGS